MLKSVVQKDKWGSDLQLLRCGDLCSKPHSRKIQKDRAILEQYEVHLSVTPSLEEKGFEARQLRTVR